MIKREALLVAIGAAALVSGCAGPMFEGSIFEQPPRTDPEVARVATSAQQMSVDFRQLSEQVSALNHTQEALDARLTRLEAQVNTASRNPDDLVAVRRDLQLIRADRETLKKEITDDLAGRVEKIAARQQAEIRAARPAPAPAASLGSASSHPAGTAATGGRSGYEHKVEKGQTLSVIAKGYGKSVESIMKANKLSNPSSIRVGQVLFIPD